MKKNGLIKGFIDFISKGNIIDLAIAVVMGQAFGAIVASFIKDILLPLFAAIFGAKGKFEDLYFVLNGTNINYGSFINSIVYFFTIALFIYIFIIVLFKGAQKKIAERNKKEEVEEPKPAPVPEDISLLREIKEELKKLNKDK